MRVKPKIETFAKIKVVGIGGGGNAAVSRMVESRIRGIEFIAINADAQALHNCAAKTKIHIGKNLTHGLGGGMNPEIGKRAVEEDKEGIVKVLEGADMVFVTCGLGGSIGSGGSSPIAELAREKGALTIGFVTKPFSFEGAQRKRIADVAWEELVGRVDSLVTIPNDRILQIIDRKTSLLDAFGVVDDVLRQGVQGISDIITTAGIVNVDFADVKTIMQDTGSALMGIGQASGEDRAVKAAKAAIDSPLLELSIDGAKGVLFNVTGGDDLGMYEIDEAARVITENADSNAKVIFGAVIDKALKDEVKITVIATGFDDTRKKKTGLRDEKKEKKEPPEIETSQIKTDENFLRESEELDIPAFIRKKMK